VKLQRVVEAVPDVKAEADDAPAQFSDFWFLKVPHAQVPKYRQVVAQLS
jgi:hypothetical protein